MEMSTGSSLPQEVLDRVIEELDNVTTLGRCALASRTLLNASRRARFRETRLVWGMQCYGLAYLLEDNPHLSPLIRSLYVVDQMPDAYPVDRVFDYWPELIKVFKRVPRLVEFHLSVEDRYGTFDDLPTELKAAFLDLFKTPSISTLSLSGLAAFPLSHLAKCPQLKTLEIRHMNISDAPNRCVPLPLSHPIATCQLQSLSVGCSSCAQSILNVFPVNTFKRLTIEDMPFQDGSALISAAQGSLSHISLGNLTDVPEVASMDLTSLMDLSISAFCVPENIVNLAAISVLLESGGSAPRKIENIGLLFMGVDDQTQASLILDHPVWQRLEAVTLQDRYVGLREVRVTMEKSQKESDFDEYYSDAELDDTEDAPPTDDTSDNVNSTVATDNTPGDASNFQQFWQKVPSLWKSGKLHVSWDGNVLTPGNL